MRIATEITLDNSNQNNQNLKIRINFIFFFVNHVYIFVDNCKSKFNMPKILFEINYNIDPEKREDFLTTIEDLKKSIAQTSGNSYSVFESKKNPNNFTEVYLYDNEEEFDAMEDNQSDETVRLTQKLFEDFIQDKKVSYSTKYEVTS